MNKETNLQIIREAVVKSQPEIVEEHSLQCDMDDSRGYITPHQELGCTVREIRLADVLLAIKNSNVNAEKIWGVDVFSGEFFGQSQSDGSPNYYKGAQWKLTNDNLEEQKDSTIKFLADLLATK